MNEVIQQTAKGICLKPNDQVANAGCSGTTRLDLIKEKYKNVRENILSELNVEDKALDPKEFELLINFSMALFFLGDSAKEVLRYVKKNKANTENNSNNWVIIESINSIILAIVKEISDIFNKEIEPKRIFKLRTEKFLLSKSNCIDLAEIYELLVELQYYIRTFKSSLYLRNFKQQNVKYVADPLVRHAYNVIHYYDCCCLNLKELFKKCDDNWKMSELFNVITNTVNTSSILEEYYLIKKERKDLI